MLKFINKKRAFQWILFAGLLAFSVYTIITETQQLSEDGTTFLFKRFVQLFEQHVLWGKGITIAVLLIQILLLQYFFRRHEYTVKRNMLPTCFYLSILLITKSLVTISPFFFTILFFVAIVSIDFTVMAAKLKNNVFWAGILIAFATCFDTSSGILLILVIVTLFVNQFFKMKEIGILFFGFALIYLYLFSYFFLTNNLDEWLSTFQHISILGILDIDICNTVYPLLHLTSLGIMYFYFIIRTRIINDSRIVKQRNRISTFNIWSILMFACFFITHSTYPHFLGYIFVPISVYLTLLVQEKNPLYINELTTIITLLLLWV